MNGKTAGIMAGTEIMVGIMDMTMDGVDVDCFIEDIITMDEVRHKQWYRHTSFGGTIFKFFISRPLVFVFQPKHTCISLNDC